MTNEERRVPCEVYSRIVGYLRSMSNWSKHKVNEFHDRRTYENVGERISEHEDGIQALEDN